MTFRGLHLLPRTTEIDASEAVSLVVVLLVTVLGGENAHEGPRRSGS